MAEIFNVVLLGKILPDHDKNDVLEKASKLFKIDAKQIASMLNGKRLIIKRNIDETSARRYVEAIARVGLACTFEPQTITISKSKLDNKKTSDEVCPKCGFVIQDENVTECSQCGLIIDKYLKADNLSDTTNVETSLLDHKSKHIAKEAPKDIRICAGLGSMMIAGAAINIVLPVVATVIYFFNRDLLSNPLPDSYSAIMAVSRIENIYNFCFLLIWLVVSFFYFVIYPTRNGRTWAQKFLDIEIHSSNPNKNINILTWVIRAVSNFLYIIPVLLLVGLLELPEYNNSGILLFLLLLYFIFMILFIYKGKRSFADFLSSTRQLQTTPKYGNPKIGMWIIIIVSLSISLTSYSFSRMVITPAKSFEPTAEELAAHRKNILEKIFILQHTHFIQYGTYTEDSMELLRQYVNMRSVENIQLVRAVTEGMVFIELSGDGYRAGISLGKPPDTYYIYTQDGDQGIHKGKYDRVNRKLILEP